MTAPPCSARRPGDRAGVSEVSCVEPGVEPGVDESYIGERSDVGGARGRRTQRPDTAFVVAAVPVFFVSVVALFGRFVGAAIAAAS